MMGRIRGKGKPAKVIAFVRGGANRRRKMIDSYTKAVLTVIALALVALAAELAVPSANAQFGFALGCDGSPDAPCFIRIVN